jgi:hypothetical protein
MPDDYAGAIPNLEALKLVLTFSIKVVSLPDRLDLRKADKFLDVPDMPVAQEIASHDHNFQFELEVTAPLK